jgi:hypothetical protein
LDKTAAKTPSEQDDPFSRYPLQARRLSSTTSSYAGRNLLVIARSQHLRPVTNLERFVRRSEYLAADLRSVVTPHFHISLLTAPWQYA